MRFTPTSNYGFHVKLANGVTVSVQWGYGNYCDDRYSPAKERSMYDIKPDGTRDTSKFTGEYVTAEVASWDDLDNWFTLGDYDTVIGWQSPAEVEKIIMGQAALDLDSAHYWHFWSAEMLQTKQAHHRHRAASENVAEFADNVEKLVTDLLSIVDDMRTGINYPERDAMQKDFLAALSGLLETADKGDSWQTPIERALYEATNIKSTEGNIKKHAERASLNAKRARELSKK